jgi:hypothetical protein
VTERTLYKAGLILTGLFATGHFTGFIQASLAARRDPALADLTRAMRAQGSTVAGMRATILDYREYFSVSYSILLVLVIALGATALSEGAGQLAIKQMSARIAMAMAVLCGASLYYHVFQGVVSCGVIALVFAAAWWMA